MKRKKNKILNFKPNGMRTKDSSNNYIKELLGRKTSVKEVIEQQEYIETSIKEHLENKKYNVYLSKINFPLRITIITSPKLLKPDIKELKYNFGLSDYELETDLTDNIGQYYFR